MPETEPSIDQNPGRWVFGLFGTAFIGAGVQTGVQALMTPHIGSLLFPVVTVVIGLILVLIGALWKKFGLRRFEFFTRLNKLAAHPGLWVGLAMAIWLATMVLQAIKEVRLNNQILALRNDVGSMANTIDRFVMPRRLTPEQEDRIAEHLQNFPPQKFAFVIVPGDNEASDYTGFLLRALNKGGWHLQNSAPSNATNSPMEGLTITMTRSISHSQEPHDSKNPSGDLTLEEALGLAGVKVEGFSDGSADIPEDIVTLSIGHRRRDSLADSQGVNNFD